MRKNAGIIVAVLLCLLSSGSHAAQSAAALPSTAGLQEIELRGLDQAWQRPDAGAGRYSKILISPATLSFQKYWERQFTSSAADPHSRLDPDQVARISAEMRESFDEAFAQSLRTAGYEIVAEAGADVLQLLPRLVDFQVNNPDVPTAARTEVFVMRAGQATLIVEARDGQSGELLAWTQDRRETRDNQMLRRSNRGFNIADFRDLFRSWGKIVARDFAPIAIQHELAANQVD